MGRNDNRTARGTQSTAQAQEQRGCRPVFYHEARAPMGQGRKQYRIPDTGKLVTKQDDAIAKEFAKVLKELKIARHTCGFLRPAAHV